MSLTFGYNLEDGDKIIEASNQLASIIRPLTLPVRGALVNLFPFRAGFNFIFAYCVSWLSSVRHIPSWVPYFSYESLVQRGRKVGERLKNEPIEFVKNALVCGYYALTFTFTEIACHSIMARPCIHWRANICRS
jgi:hypothetical protein